MLLHFNPMRVRAGEESDAEVDAVLERFALDVRNHSNMAPEMWDKACALMEANSGGLGDC